MAILGGILIGFLVGLAYCYYKQALVLYQNRDLISSGGNLITAAQDFYGALSQKF